MNLQTRRRVKGAMLCACCMTPFLWGTRRGQINSCARNEWMPLCGGTCARVQACRCVFSESILGWVVTVYTGQRYRTVKTYWTQHLIWIICKFQGNQKEQRLKPKNIKRKMFNSSKKRKGRRNAKDEEESQCGSEDGLGHPSDLCSAQGPWQGGPWWRWCQQLPWPLPGTTHTQLILTLSPVDCRIIPIWWRGNGRTQVHPQGCTESRWSWDLNQGQAEACTHTLPCTTSAPCPCSRGGHLFFIPWLHQKGQMNLLAKESGAREKRTQTSIGAPCLLSLRVGQWPRQDEEGSLMFPRAHHSEEHVFLLIFVTYLHLFERQQFWHRGSFFSCLYVCLTDYLWK